MRKKISVLTCHTNPSPRTLIRQNGIFNPSLAEVPLSFVELGIQILSSCTAAVHQLRKSSILYMDLRSASFRNGSHNGSSVGFAHEYCTCIEHCRKKTSVHSPVASFPDANCQHTHDIDSQQLVQRFASSSSRLHTTMYGYRYLHVPGTINSPDGIHVSQLTI